MRDLSKLVTRSGVELPTSQIKNASKDLASSRKKSLSFPGGGVKAFYQFGIAEALRKHCAEDLDSCDLYGASSGAITAVFVATGVCFRQVHLHFYLFLYDYSLHACVYMYIYNSASMI